MKRSLEEVMENDARDAFSIVDSFCNVLVEIAEGKSTIKDLAVLLENE